MKPGRQVGQEEVAWNEKSSCKNIFSGAVEMQKKLSFFPPLIIKAVIY
jgi:hypothetical protein